MSSSQGGLISNSTTGTVIYSTKRSLYDSTNFHIQLVEHSSFDILEIISYETNVQVECPRIYIKKSYVNSLVDDAAVKMAALEDDALVEDSNVVTSEDDLHARIRTRLLAETILEMMSVVDFSYSRHIVKVTLNPRVMDDIQTFQKAICDKPPALDRYKSPHFKQLLESELALELESEQLHASERTLLATGLTVKERWRIPIVYVKKRNGKGLNKLDDKIWTILKKQIVGSSGLSLGDDDLCLLLSKRIDKGRLAVLPEGENASEEERGHEEEEEEGEEIAPACTTVKVKPRSSFSTKSGGGGGGASGSHPHQHHGHSKVCHSTKNPAAAIVGTSKKRIEGAKSFDSMKLCNSSKSGSSSRHLTITAAASMDGSDGSHPIPCSTKSGSRPHHRSLSSSSSSSSTTTTTTTTTSSSSAASMKGLVRHDSQDSYSLLLTKFNSSVGNDHLFITSPRTQQGPTEHQTSAKSVKTAVKTTKSASTGKQQSFRQNSGVDKGSGTDSTVGPAGNDGNGEMEDFSGKYMGADFLATIAAFSSTVVKQGFQGLRSSFVSAKVDIVKQEEEEEENVAPPLVENNADATAGGGGSGSGRVDSSGVDDDSSTVVTSNIHPSSSKNSLCNELHDESNKASHQHQHLSHHSVMSPRTPHLVVHKEFLISPRTAASIASNGGEGADPCSSDHQHHSHHHNQHHNHHHHATAGGLSISGRHGIQPHHVAHIDNDAEAADKYSQLLLGANMDAPHHHHHHTHRHHPPGTKRLSESASSFEHTHVIGDFPAEENNSAGGGAGTGGGVNAAMSTELQHHEQPPHHRPHHHHGRSASLVVGSESTNKLSQIAEGLQDYSSSSSHDKVHLAPHRRSHSHCSSSSSSSSMGVAENHHHHHPHHHPHHRRAATFTGSRMSQRQLQHDEHQSPLPVSAEVDKTEKN